MEKIKLFNLADDVDTILGNLDKKIGDNDKKLSSIAKTIEETKTRISDFEDKIKHDRFRFGKREHRKMMLKEKEQLAAKLDEQFEVTKQKEYAEMEKARFEEIKAKIQKVKDLEVKLETETDDSKRIGLEKDYGDAVADLELYMKNIKTVDDNPRFLNSVKNVLRVISKPAEFIYSKISVGPANDAHHSGYKNYFANLGVRELIEGLTLMVFTGNPFVALGVPLVLNTFDWAVAPLFRKVIDKYDDVLIKAGVISKSNKSFNKKMNNLYQKTFEKKRGLFFTGKEKAERKAPELAPDLEEAFTNRVNNILTIINDFINDTKTTYTDDEKKEIQKNYVILCTLRSDLSKNGKHLSDYGFTDDMLKAYLDKMISIGMCTENDKYLFGVGRFERFAPKDTNNLESKLTSAIKEFESKDLKKLKDDEKKKIENYYIEVTGIINSLRSTDVNYLNKNISDLLSKFISLYSQYDNVKALSLNTMITEDNLKFVTLASFEEQAKALEDKTDPIEKSEFDELEKRYNAITNKTPEIDARFAALRTKAGIVVPAFDTDDLDTIINKLTVKAAHNEEITDDEVKALNDKKVGVTLTPHQELIIKTITAEYDKQVKVKKALASKAKKIENARKASDVRTQKVMTDENLRKFITRLDVRNLSAIVGNNCTIVTPIMENTMYRDKVMEIITPEQRDNVEFFDKKYSSAKSDYVREAKLFIDRIEMAKGKTIEYETIINDYEALDDDIKIVIEGIMTDNQKVAFQTMFNSVNRRKK